MKKAFLAVLILCSFTISKGQDTTTVTAQFKVRDLLYCKPILFQQGDTNRIKLLYAIPSLTTGKTGTTYVQIVTTGEIIHAMNGALGNIPSGIYSIYTSFKQDLYTVRANYPTVNVACIADSTALINNYINQLQQNSR